MSVIGLTGGIGAGKSLVANYFLSLGAQVVDSDQLARQAIERGSDGFDQVVTAFGDGILREGEIDRRVLGEIVFSDPEKRKLLENIVHPKVQQAFLEIRKSVSENEILIYELPLLVETGAELLFDSIITVEAPLEKRIERLKARGLFQSEIEKRILSQTTPEARRSKATYVIENDSDQETLLRRVESIWEELNASSK